MPGNAFIVLHSFPGRAEQETAQRIVDAATAMGIRAGIATTQQHIDAFAPDFVLCLSHHETRPVGYPCYGVVMAPLAWLSDDAASLGRILSHDGFLTVSDAIRDWLRQTCRHLGQPEPLIESFYPNSAATPSPPPDRPLDHAAYVGTNWDGWRNLRLFQLLGQRSDVRCYGPRASWRHLPPCVYGGEIPFDGTSVVRTYARAGIGLGLERPDFLPEAIPTNRVFEIAAAGAVALMADTPFVRKHFADLTLPLDHLAPPSALAWQIGRHLDWIAANPSQARAMADAAHSSFNRDWAMERQMTALLRLHAQACRRAWATTRLPSMAALAALATRSQIETRLAARFDLGTAGNDDFWPLPAGAMVTVRAFIPADQHVPSLPAELRDGAGEIVWRGTLRAEPPVGNLGCLTATLPTRDGQPVRLVIHGPRMLATVADLDMPRASRPLASLAEGGGVWIYGTGEGGKRVATQLRQQSGSAPSGFIDDFRHDRMGDVAVAPAAHWLPHLGADDAIILANQHWPDLWRRLYARTRARLYVAHPEYGPLVHALPPGPR